MPIVPPSGRAFGLGALTALALAGCTESAPSALETAIWNSGPYPGTPWPQTSPAGEAILKLVPRGAPRSTAVESLKVQGFCLGERSWPEEGGNPEIFGAMTEWCKGTSCRKTEVVFILRGGRVVSADGYGTDYEPRWISSWRTDWLNGTFAGRCVNGRRPGR